MLTTVVLIVVMLLLSAFFSGMEIAFTSKNRLKLEIDRKQSRMFDRIADIFSRHPGQYITTILVGNNIALVIYSLYMSLLLRGIFYALGWESIARNGSVAIETAVSTVIIIFFAEFLPKSVFRNNPNFYYRALAPVIYFFYLLLYPIARLTTLISHGILRLTGRRVEERTTTHSFDREDLASLLDTNSSEPRPEPDNELKLFQNALDFADLRVRDCMVPRVDVEAVDIDDTTIEQLTARFVDSKYSRIFVWRKSIDNIIGVLQIRKYVRVYLRERKYPELRSLLDAPCFVHQSTSIDELLEELNRQKVSLAVVTDNYGGTMGIVTVEDIIEELVGEIWDEDDVAQVEFRALGGDTYEVSADMDMEDLFDELGYDDPENTDWEHKPVGEWVYEQFDMIPAQGESFTWHRLKVTVESIDHRRIRKLLIRLLPEETQEGGEEA